MFSATQRLMANKHLSMVDAEDLVYIDHYMVPLMVQEAYVMGIEDDHINELERVSEMISYGDGIQSAIGKTQDWTLLPLFVANTVAVSKTVPGPAPLRIFPQILGKMSTKSKHARYIELLARKECVSAQKMRLEYADSLQTIMVTPLLAEKPNIELAVDSLRGWDRDDLLEHLPAVLSAPLEVPTKVKSAITRLYNKRAGSKRKADSMDLVEFTDDTDINEIEDRLLGFRII